MHFPLFLAASAILSLRLVSAQQYATPELTFHPLYRADLKFENLVVRENGQILISTVAPNASIYQVDPLGILPTTLIYTIPNTSSAAGLVERSPGIFYVATTYANLTDPSKTVPSFYSIEELDLRNVSVLPSGKLSQSPVTNRVASLPAAALLNGIAFSRPGSEQLLVADSYRGLIWNVNVKTGNVGVSFNDSSTKGPAPTGPGVTGVNGLKVYNNTMYWTNTGRSSLYAITVDENGNPPAGATATLLAKGIMGGVDDFVMDSQGNAYICGPYNVLTKVYPGGRSEIIAGTFNSSMSALGGPTAARFGKLVSDRFSLYVTTNGGIFTHVANSSGLSRIDLGFN